MKTFLSGVAALLMMAGIASAQSGGAGVGIDVSASAGGNAGNVNVSAQGSANATTASQRPEHVPPQKPTQANEKSTTAPNGTEESMRGGISVAARDVDGLTEEEKTAFLARVKAHAQVKSEQDLENFAKGVLLRDENVEDVEYSDEEITVAYKGKGKLLGFIPVGFTHRITVDTDAPAAEKVKVHFPWYSFLLKTGLNADEIETEIAANLSANLTAGEMGARISAYAKTFVDIANKLKAENEAAANL
jgi:hypothetical protein